jgi:hypothetical protein
MNFAHKYSLFIKGDTIKEILGESLHFAYFFLGRELQLHRQSGENGEYETFLVEMLALLQKNWYLYTAVPEAPEPE